MKKFLVLTLISIGLFSCSEKTTDEKIALDTSDKIFYNFVEGNGAFKAFSLSKNDSISVDTLSKRSTWDFAIKSVQTDRGPRYTVIINGGVSGIAKNMAYIDTSKYYADLKITPTDLDKKIRTDSVNSYAITTKAGFWYLYNAATMSLTPNPKHAIIIKKADGKIVRLQFLYINLITNKETNTIDSSKNGYYTFKWSYLN
jgi:hypothetical protein